MASLQLTLFGGFQACSASGKELALPRRKAMLLLACLALRPGEPQTREKIMGLFWSDRGDVQARGSLRQALTTLRKTLNETAPASLIVSGEKLWLDPAAVDVDVDRFEALVRSDATDDLERAAGLYRGTFLDGIAVRDAEGEHWLLGERERLRELLLAGLDRLLTLQMQDGAVDRAAATAERILVHDPLRENAHRTLMRLHAQHGRCNLALRQYRHCQKLLSRELDVQPEPETRKLYEDILRQRPAPPARPSAPQIGLAAPDAGGAGSRPSLVDVAAAEPYETDESVARPIDGLRRTECAIPMPPDPTHRRREPSLPAAAPAAAEASALGSEPDTNGSEGAATARPSIAVLPFTNIGGDPDQEYFADGLTEDIITDLSQVSGLFVVARHTVFTLRGRPVRVQDAAREMNVRYILEGSVRKASARVRITTQLVDGTTGGLVWAHRYDRGLDDIIALQGEISSSIVDVLKVKLLPGELETITHQATTSAVAYENYLIGRSFYLRGLDRRSLTIARALFAKAIEIDPNYARAYAGAAICDSYLTMSSSDASFENTLAMISRALELEPNLAEAYAVKGLVLFAVGRYDEAAGEFEHALTLGPELFEAHYFYARNCRLQGRHGEAAALFAQAAELRPNDFRSIGLLAEQYKTLGRRDEFLSAARRCLERLAVELAAHADNADAWAFGSAILAQLGQETRAEEWATRALTIGPDGYMVRYNVARTYALLGKLDAAFDQLEGAFGALPELQRRLGAWMQHDAEIAPLRSHPRFRDLETRLEVAPNWATPAAVSPDPQAIAVLPFRSINGDGEGEYSGDSPVKPFIGELKVIAGRRTANAQAYEYYLVGRSFYLRGIDKHSLRIAREMFVKAREIDPRYARAHAAIAVCDFYLAMSNPNGSFESALANATRALEVEPKLAEAYAAKGLALYAVGRYGAAQAEFERAMTCDPNLFEAHFFYGRNCRLQGLHGQAATLFERASELRPSDFRSLGLLSVAYRSLGRCEDSLATARRCAQRLEAEIALHPDNADALAFGSALLAELGDTARAETWAAQALMIGADDYLVQYNVARTYALLGQFDEALPRLRRAFGTSPACRRRLTEWMKQDEKIDPLRGDPRFQALAQRLASEARAQP